ncbi:Hypothetical protein D9617_5g069130 [Elsinoe fawcettii]|nr:Hypothetical protein D9617_5g069130 [Elsinoe fawcettii]
MIEAILEAVPWVRDGWNSLIITLDGAHDFVTNILPSIEQHLMNGYIGGLVRTAYGEIWIRALTSIATMRANGCDVFVWDVPAWNNPTRDAARAFAQKYGQTKGPLTVQVKARPQ